MEEVLLHWNVGRWDTECDMVPFLRIRHSKPLECWKVCIRFVKIAVIGSFPPLPFLIAFLIRKGRTKWLQHQQHDLAEKLVPPVGYFTAITGLNLLLTYDRDRINHFHRFHQVKRCWKVSFVMALLQVTSHLYLPIPRNKMSFSPAQHARNRMHTKIFAFRPGQTVKLRSSTLLTQMT